jgi:GH15 family glucan-1,4-alpha-glucosidase
MSFFIPTAATGNGRVLVTVGRSGELMGFFYPRIDFAQNIREGMPAVRLAGAGHDRFLWCFDDAWRVAQSFERASNVLITRWAHRHLNITVELLDVTPPGETALMRRVVVQRAVGAPAVQFMHYFQMAVGDTGPRNGVYVFPDQNMILQHARETAIAFTSTSPFAAMCTSIKPGAESGVKIAMYSGKLSAFHQAIGRVDFAAAFEPVTQPTWEATLVLAGGNSPTAAMAEAQRLVNTPIAAAIDAAATRCHQQLALAGPCPSPELEDAFERAVMSLHDLYDEAHGTFIAAPEFDPGYELSGGYGYCWPRDAAVCALAMHRIGFTEKALRFFDWAARTQLPDGHWFQRYWLDGSPAPSWCVQSGQIQLDQTCAMVHAAGLLARQLGDSAGSFVKRFGPTAQQATTAILRHIGPNQLHLPATDLWENSQGAFAYTQAAIVSALREAEEVFGIEPARTGPAARALLMDALVKAFWQSDRRRWLRRIAPDGTPDATLDSSAMGIIDPWLVLDLGDPVQRRLAADTLDGISTDLRSPVKSGGAILRFAGESYMGGGPGCVNTIWLALCRLRLAATAAIVPEMREHRALAMEELRVALANTSPTGQLPELIPRIRFDYWAAPHAWASSLLIECVLALRGLEPPPSEFDAVRAQVRRRSPSR